MKKIKYLSIVALYSLSACGTSIDCVHKLPASKQLMRLNNNVVERTALKALSKIASYASNSNEEDSVYSPASYMLAVAGLSSVSENFNNEAFGLDNALTDAKSFLEAWNFSYKTKSNSTIFKSCVLHQQIGERYKFDKQKQTQIANNYISSLVSSAENYASDANEFFKNKMGLTIKVPELELDNGVATYGAIKMKDSVANGFGVIKNPFNFKNGTENVDSYTFGSEFIPYNLQYFKGENYQSFIIPICNTSLLIVLPDNEIDVNSINVSEAYDSFLKGKESVPAYGYIPYFHNKTNCANLTESLTAEMNGNEILYSSLLDDSVVNDLGVKSVLQTSDFEFDKYGVSGESITVVYGDGASFDPSQDKPIEIKVNRPFYAISLYDNFPLFVNKVNNPGKKI